jgi:hypothetical protein
MPRDQCDGFLDRQRTIQLYIKNIELFFYGPSLEDFGESSLLVYGGIRE